MVALLKEVALPDTTFLIKSGCQKKSHFPYFTSQQQQQKHLSFYSAFFLAWKQGVFDLSSTLFQKIK